MSRRRIVALLVLGMCTLWAISMGDSPPPDEAHTPAPKAPKAPPKSQPKTDKAAKTKTQSLRPPPKKTPQEVVLVAPSNPNDTQTPSVGKPAKRPTAAPDTINHEHTPKDPPVVVEAIAKTAPPSTESTTPKEATPNTESDAEVFARLFSRRAPSASAVVAPFLLDGQARGEVLVEVEDQDAKFVAAPILLGLSKRVDAKTMQALSAKVDARGRLSLQSTREVGLGAAFDPSRLELRITTSPELLATSVHSLQTTGLPEGAADAQRPSTLSGYLNVNGAQRVSWSDSEDASRQPFALQLDGALQWRGWVVEGRPDFLEERAQAWRRNGLLLLRDDPTRALRYVAGDFSMPTFGLQPSVAVAGVGVIRNFALQPYTGTRPTSRFAFFLARPSEVSILVNGVPLQTLTLPAGHHDLRDLPMAFSVNDIKLLIRDDTGISRELSFRASTAGELLAPGRHQFAYSVGAPLLEESESGRDYDPSQPLLSGSHRVGVTDTLTLGGSLNASPSRQLAGPQLLWATRAGTIGLEVVGSHDATKGNGLALTARYEFLWTSRHSALRRLNLSAEHRSASFQSMSALALLPFSDDLTASYGQRIGKSLQLDLSARYQLGQEGTPNSQSAAASLSRSFLKGLSLALFTSVRSGGLSEDEARAMLTARWSLPEKGQSFQALSKNSTAEERTNQVSWAYQGQNPSQAVSASATLSEREGSYEANGLVGYAGQRAKMNLSGAASMQPEDAITKGNTTLEVSSALVFAGGRFAVSSPVSGAFAIVLPNETVRDYQIEVNPGPHGNQAWTSWLGPAVITNLQAYHLQNIKLVAPDLPVGYSLGAGSVAVLPSYKSGTLIRVGEEGTVSLRGELHFPDGTPVGLVSGELFPLGAPDRKTMFLFTNRAGRFGLEAVVPGRYELRLPNAPPVTLEIPKGHHGGYSAGVLIVGGPR